MISLVWRDNTKVWKGLVYGVIIVMSVLALLYLDSGEKALSTAKLKSGLRNLLEPTAPERQTTCDVLHDDITIISGHFNDTTHPVHRLYNPNEFYKKLATVLERINNPLVGYFDSKQATSACLKSRNEDKLKYMTKAHQVNFEETWTSSLLPLLKRTHTSSNSSLQSLSSKAEHIGFQHLKYELVQKTLERNPFCTKYFAWIDFDLLLDLSTKLDLTKDLWFFIPPDLEMDRVGVVQLEALSNLTDVDIFKQNKTWICGDIFFGRKQPLMHFIDQYLNELLQLLGKGLAGSDANVLYAINVNPSDNVRMKTKLQVYDSTNLANKNCLDLLLLLKQSGDEVATKT